MRVREDIDIDDRELTDFCARHGIQRLSLYGSALGDRFTDRSDIDLLVEFRLDATPGLIRLAAMELELGGMLGREVELRTSADLSPYFRAQVLSDARQLYAA